MANNELIIPSNVPAHVSALFAQLHGINAAATDGISAGMYPIIKLSGTRFVLVKDGEESAVKSLELKVVVLSAKPGFEKRYYAHKYDPNSTVAVQPDCWSSNGITPEPGVSNQQNPSCAGCKQNQFGSGTDQNGNPGKGKACSDRKVLAVLYPNPDTKALEIYGFSLPPASLKSWGAYVQSLTANNVPLPAAFTVIGFDEKSSFAVLNFRYGGLMGEKELGAVVPMIQSPEVKAIIESKVVAQSPVPPAQAVAKVEPPKDDSGFGFEPEAPAEKPKQPRAPRAAKPKDEPAKEETPAEESGMFGGSEDVSDDDLSAMLGISL